MKVIKFLACLFLGSEAARTEMHAALMQGWSKPHDIQKLKTGTTETELCPDLVPKRGEMFEFRVRQYKNKPTQKMSYHFVLHKVNDEAVDLSIGAGQGTKVYNNDKKKVWTIKRHFGAARFFGKHLSDSLYFVHGGYADFTLRRIAMTIPQRWTIHRTHTFGGTPGTKKSKDYDKTRLYWIKGHKGKYNVFKTPEDSKAWGKAGKKKRQEMQHKLVAYIRKGHDPVDNHMTHKVVCKEGVDCGLILSMLQTFRWEHFVGVAATLMPITQWGGHYQADGGVVHGSSKGKNPVLKKSLLELNETEAESEELELNDALDDVLDDGLDDTELAEYFEEGEVDDDTEFAEYFEEGEYGEGDIVDDEDE